MSRLINALLRVFLLAIFAVGLVALWEQIRTSDYLSRFRRTDSAAQSVIIKEITSLGRLELVKYTFRDIVEHEQLKTFWPNSSAVLIVEGEATGCLDLTRIKPDDIRIGGDSVIVNLPRPELCGWKVNHDRSRVYDTRFAFLDESQLVSDAYRQAEQQIRQSALRSNILEQTRRNAVPLLQPLLERVSGRRVVLVFQP
ncbi:DUF4230 domain-containing protein [Fibrisoma montanum]|uniref:DUF4230 domain-containing protein n=1 Tax=Fibrisoma montanum TaxID=2305895 RepID=A0A418LZV4_9BACT|nr:DUF4230 domain-containing protein [Fibrisoma montanum]RIV18765.1 DUF4230 domain-containing protein [Fibrisoma montanum]